MNPVLITILFATTLAGVVSITAAGLLSFALLSKVVERMASVSVGIMLLNAGYSRTRAYL